MDTWGSVEGPRGRLPPTTNATTCPAPLLQGPVSRHKENKGQGLKAAPRPPTPPAPVSHPAPTLGSCCILRPAPTSQPPPSSLPPQPCLLSLPPCRGGGRPHPQLNRSPEALRTPGQPLEFPEGNEGPSARSKLGAPRKAENVPQGSGWPPALGKGPEPLRWFAHGQHWQLTALALAYRQARVHAGGSPGASARGLLAKGSKSSLSVLHWSVGPRVPQPRGKGGLTY